MAPSRSRTDCFTVRQSLLTSPVSTSFGRAATVCGRIGTPRNTPPESGPPVPRSASRAWAGAARASVRAAKARAAPLPRAPACRIGVFIVASVVLNARPKRWFVPVVTQHRNRLLGGCAPAHPPRAGVSPFLNWSARGEATFTSSDQNGAGRGATDGPSMDFELFERAAWENQAAGYVRFFGALAAEAAEPLLDAAEVAAGSEVLDLACGPGAVTSAASRRGATVIGADTSRAMLALATAR